MTLQIDRHTFSSHRIAEKTGLLTPLCLGKHRSPSPWNLTRREAEVLSLLLHRLTDGEIAAHLNISVRTVECHVERVLGKLDVANRREAASIAARWITA